MKVSKQPEYGGPLWKLWESVDPSAKPAKELKRFALRDKLSKDKKDDEVVWPKPTSQSSGDEDSQSRESRDSRTEQEAKKMPIFIPRCPLSSKNQMSSHNRKAQRRKSG